MIIFFKNEFCMNKQVTLSCFSKVSVHLDYWQYENDSYIYFIKMSKDITAKRR